MWDRRTKLPRRRHLKRLALPVHEQGCLCRLACLWDWGWGLPCWNALGQETLLLDDRQVYTVLKLTTRRPSQPRLWESLWNQCHLDSVKLVTSLEVHCVTADFCLTGAQYHAEVTLHTSWQNRGTVRQREVDSWEDPREGYEEKGVTFISFSFFHRVSWLTVQLPVWITEELSVASIFIISNYTLRILDWLIKYTGIITGPHVSPLSYSLGKLLSRVLKKYLSHKQLEKNTFPFWELGTKFWKMLSSQRSCKSMVGSTLPAVSVVWVNCTVNYSTKN